MLERWKVASGQNDLAAVAEAYAACPDVDFRGDLAGLRVTNGVPRSPLTVKPLASGLALTIKLGAGSG